MGRPILKAADFAVAFAFSRSEEAAYRDASGDPQAAPADAPRFDHDDQGAPLGLLIGAGSDVGRRDRAAFDPFMLPLDVMPSPAVPRPPVTVLHRFDAGSGEERRAWYSRDPAATVDALLRQAGHHREIGVVPGFLPNRLLTFGQPPVVRGYVEYRDRQWILPGVFAIDGDALVDGAGHPLIEAGA